MGGCYPRSGSFFGWYWDKSVQYPNRDGSLVERWCCRVSKRLVRMDSSRDERARSYFDFSSGTIFFVHYWHGRRHQIIRSRPIDQCVQYDRSTRRVCIGEHVSQ